MPIKHPVYREFVARCTQGCRTRDKQGNDTGPLHLEAFELDAHDDAHLSDAARTIVRDLRDAGPEARDEAIAYFARRKTRSAVHADLLAKPERVQVAGPKEG